MSQPPTLSLSGFPPTLVDWLGDSALHSGFDATDLREMAKLGETTNIHGCAIHPLRLPPDPSGLLETHGGLDNLDAKTAKTLAEALRAEPLLLLLGELAGATSRARKIAYLCPQKWAQVAMIFESVMWTPSADADATNAKADANANAFEPDLTIVQLPDYPDPVMLNLPESRTALILGTDDPRPGLVVALEQANRVWNAEFEAARTATKGASGGGTPPLVKIASGGTFLFPRAGNANLAMAFPGESVPLSWEEDLKNDFPELRALEVNDIRLAGSEPWVVESGGRTSPFWRNPMLPSDLLSATSVWNDAALDPDSVLLGVATDSSGKVEFKGPESEGGIVVCPRARVPAPFWASGETEETTDAAAPAELFTHKNAKPDAMDYWALGLPSPVVPA